MDQALSTFFSYSTTDTTTATATAIGLKDERVSEGVSECVQEDSIATVESDDMSSSVDESERVSERVSGGESNGGSGGVSESVSDCSTAATHSHTHSLKPVRDISAPFQPSPRNHSLTRFCPMTERDRPATRVDYLSTAFQPLDVDKDITYDKYVGPTPESNWVIPGKLLVGAYPASQDDTETFELLTSILKLGVTKFVCLQLEYKSNVTENEWRNGQALRPYYEDVSLLVKNKQMFKVLANDENVCSTEQLSFVHFPIKDCSVTDDGGVFNLAVELVEAIAAGEVLYLHCWGGHGRTGTLVCIMLHLMYSLNATDAMAYCQRTHDLRQCPVVVGSPQTRTQCDQVRRIVDIMMKQEKRHQQQQKRQREQESTHSTTTTLSSNPGPTHFTFEEHQQLPDEMHREKGVGGELDEELLCKRMAGKSFDAVMEDGVCHVIPGNSDGTSASVSNVPTTSNSSALLSGPGLGAVMNGTDHQDEGTTSTHTSGVTLPPAAVPHQHNQLTASTTSATATAQPPLKFRLVEKNANSTRNAYTQKVLGKSSLPPQNMKPKPKVTVTVKTTTEQDVLPLVPPGGTTLPLGTDETTTSPSTVVASTTDKDDHLISTVQAQPPKHSSPRSSRPGGLKEMRSHSEENSETNNQQVPMQVQSQSSEMDKSSEVSAATTTTTTTTTADQVANGSSEKKWSFGNPFAKKSDEDNAEGKKSTVDVIERSMEFSL